MIKIQQELAFKRRKRSVVDKKNQSEMYSIILKNPIDKLISMSDKKFYIGFVFNDKNIFERFLKV